MVDINIYSTELISWCGFRHVRADHGEESRNERCRHSVCPHRVYLVSHLINNGHLAPQSESNCQTRLEYSLHANLSCVHIGIGDILGTLLCQCVLDVSWPC